MLRSEMASTVASEMRSSFLAPSMTLLVMPNSSTAPSSAMPMAWPTLRMVVWMPPDWAASRSFTARATTLLAWAETMPAPEPARMQPTTMPGREAESRVTEKAMVARAAARTM